MGDVGPRRQAREAALQVLYAADVAGKLDPDSVECVFEQVATEFSLPRRARERAAELCTGVVGNLAKLDAAIAGASTAWKLHRIPAVERNVLRIAGFELLCEAAPPEVVIDEAVEIARRFGGARTPAFVNGVLDALWRAWHNGAP
jgi:N utilization substance protein B